MWKPTDIFSSLSLPSDLVSYLSSLHTKSLDQESAIDKNATAASKARYPSGPKGAKREMDDLMRDKYMVLDPNKCVFIFNVLLSIGARTVVELGTSFGISTIYLACAVNEVVKRNGGMGKVAATEKEAFQIPCCKANLEEGGSGWRVGDRESVRAEEG